jgi:hypothetical protein
MQSCCCIAPSNLLQGRDFNQEEAMSTTSTVAPEDRVRAVAYSLWLDEGRPHGRAESHWLKAQEIVNAEAAVEPAPKRKAPARKRIVRS